MAPAREGLPSQVSGTGKCLSHASALPAGKTLSTLAREFRTTCSTEFPLSCVNHLIQGGGYAIDNLHFMKGIEPDGYLTISGDVARITAKELAQYEGIFGGFSAGANVAGAMALLREEMKGKTIVAVICDSGLKYLSTDLWD